MTIREQIKQQRKEVMKNGTRAEKWAYFFEHYRLLLIGFIILIIIALCFISGKFFINQTKTSSSTEYLNGILLNVKNKTVASTLADDFTKYIGKKNIARVTLDTSHTYVPNDDGSHSDENFDTTEAIISQKEVKKLDFVAGPIDAMLDVAYASMFSPLEITLSAEQYELVKPYLLYIDYTVVEEVDDAVDKKKDVSSIKLPDPTKPEEMDAPLAIMIDMSSVPEFAEIYGNDEDIIAFGIITSAPNTDMLEKFIDYLMKK